MLLRQKAWIAKLNVRTGKRKRSASVVRRFTKAAVAVGKFSTVVRKYRNRIIFLQRFIRSFFVCQHARQAAMSKAWRVKEADIVAKQTIEDAKLQAEYKAREEKLAKKRAKKARPEPSPSGYMSGEKAEAELKDLRQKEWRRRLEGNYEHEPKSLELLDDFFGDFDKDLADVPPM